MRARLMFALTLAIDFECFLIDEVFAVGDQRFHRRCHDALFVERGHRAMILVSHDPRSVREYCQSALVLRGARARVRRSGARAGHLSDSLIASLVRSSKGVPGQPSTPD